MNFIVSVGSLYLVVLVLVAQRHEDELALHREQLILELVLSTVQKTAKLIEMLQQIRRDPHLADREDGEAAQMARRADPSAVLETIRDIRAETATGGKE